MKKSFLKSVVLCSLLSLVMTACWAQSVTSQSTTPITLSEAQNTEVEKQDTLSTEMPQYPGGNDAMYAFIRKTKKFPQKAVNDGVEGRVMVRVMVKKNGGLTKAKVTRSIHPSLDKEAIRVVNAMPKWIPAKRKGKTVEVLMVIPVDFYFL